MIIIDIPGVKVIEAEHLVLDYNGTIAEDGKLIAGIAEVLNSLAAKIAVHIITADTFGKAKDGLKSVNCSLKILEKNNQQQQKLQFIEKLGKEKVIAIGNGFNDLLMLKEAALAIAVIQREGASSSALMAADIVTKSIFDALGLIMNPLRIAATLRA